MGKKRSAINNIRIKGDKIGFCNICGTEGTLTYDHVVPQSCCEIKPVELRRMLGVFEPENYIPEKKFISQNGVKFRSVCQDCNNKRLGQDYDPSLMEFIRYTDRALKTKLILPEDLRIRCNPGRIARSVIGHILAIGITGKLNATLPQRAAEFFMNIEMLWPDYLDIYFWLFPYNVQVGARGLVRTSLGAPSKDHVYFDILKFYPMAFMVVWDKPVAYRPQHLNLRDYAIGSGDHPAKIPIKLTDTPRYNYPESPTGMEMLLFNDAVTFEASAYIPNRNPRTNR